jgi:hypothetical protein
MVPVLIRWLKNSGRLGNGSLVAQELPWFGRRVDVAILTRSGALLSFELKVQHNRRAIEQAARNTLTFDRSYIVTSSKPGPELEDLARALGIGVVVIDDGQVLLASPPAQHHVRLKDVRARLRNAIRTRGIRLGHV